MLFDLSGRLALPSNGIQTLTIVQDSYKSGGLCYWYLHTQSHEATPTGENAPTTPWYVCYTVMSLISDFMTLSVRSSSLKCHQQLYACRWR
jgi:hypothetical protein